MITAASLKSQTVKDLAQLAKNRGVSGWHSMRKDQLVKAILKVAKTASAKKKAKATRKSPIAKAPAKRVAATTTAKPTGPRAKKVTSPAKAKASKASRRIQKINEDRERLKDLTTPIVKKTKRRVPARPIPTKPIALEKDRIVLMVRDPYWLHAHWDLSRNNVERAKAAMAEFWHGAKPVLRVLEVESGTTTSTVEQVIRDIPIHGGVRNWYIDVADPPHSFRVEIGYIADNGRFFSMARSNAVTTPHAGSNDDLDENWADVASNYEKVYSLSGGNDDTNSSGELQELFEERLRRPMGAPIVTRYGSGADETVKIGRNFQFDVDAELIIYGATKPNAHVTLGGEPVKLRPDGTFTVRQSMPDKRQVLPVVANSGDGVEQRTIVLAVERNTKVMEAIIREPNDP